jgi:hypothetical protein
MQRIPIIILVFFLGACGNTVSDLHYVPTTVVQTAPKASVAGVTAIDQRNEAPTRLATIMGGFGNPLKTLDTAKPVKDEVVAAFVDGLRARGLLSPTGQYQIALTVRKFDADMIIGRTARIDLTMSVNDSAGRQIFQDSAIDSQSDMKLLETGVMADIGDLRILSETVLNRTVDRMLDNPAFRAAVASMPVKSN